MPLNLPPGARISDGTEDAEWETFHDWIDTIAAERRLCPHEAKLAFDMGMAAMERVKPQVMSAMRNVDDVAWGYVKRVEPAEGATNSD